MKVELNYTKDNDVTHLSVVNQNGEKHGVYTDRETGKEVVVHLVCKEEFDSMEEAFRFIANER